MFLQPDLPPWRWRRVRVRAAVCDELRHSLLQHRQRNRAEREDGVMKLPLVELRAQLLLGLATMAANLELAKFVRQRLTGPCDVALDLSRDLVFGKRRASAQVVHRLLATPAERVDPRVDHQPARA